MIVDGKAIADALMAKVARRVTAFRTPPTLGVVIVGDDPVIESFVRIKKRAAERVGIKLKEFRFPKEITAAELEKEVHALAWSNGDIQGLIVQLPLPSHISPAPILNAVRLDRDVDMLSHDASGEFRKGTAKILPPVASAIQEILEHHGVSVVGKDVLILGHGRLVGGPAAILMRHNYAHVTVVDREVERLSSITRDADVIVSGVGKPGLLRPDMLKSGVVLIDAATSESEGRIVGDADPSCANVASLFTPVPGGVGPITVAALLKNLCIAAENDSTFVR